MNSNRTGTIFGIVSIALAGAAAILLSFAKGSVNPILTSLAAIVVVLAGLAVITTINYILFVPLFTTISKLFHRNQKRKNKELQHRV